MLIWLLTLASAHSVVPCRQSWLTQSNLKPRQSVEGQEAHSPLRRPERAKSSCWALTSLDWSSGPCELAPAASHSGCCAFSTAASCHSSSCLTGTSACMPFAEDVNRTQHEVSTQLHTHAAIHSACQQVIAAHGTTCRSACMPLAGHLVRAQPLSHLKKDLQDGQSLHVLQETCRASDMLPTAQRKGLWESEGHTFFQGCSNIYKTGNNVFQVDKAVLAGTWRRKPAAQTAMMT